MSQTYKNYIGVFDSGVGGMSVLKQCLKYLPDENYYFFGDSINAPYGERPREEIMELTMSGIGRMIDEGVKAIVIACNTATSVAAEALREKYKDIPILAIEPALKPAVLENEGKRILVMATTKTIYGDRFQNQLKKYKDKCTIYPVACPGLAERIEKGDLEKTDMKSLLDSLLKPYEGKVDCVVLGCTHYPFIKKQLRQVLGENIIFYDGGNGEARELKRQLTVRGLLNDEDQKGKVVILSSKTDPETSSIYKTIFNMEI